VKELVKYKCSMNEIMKLGYEIMVDFFINILDKVKLYFLPDNINIEYHKAFP
jgi:hypothetical protein